MKQKPHTSKLIQCEKIIFKFDAFQFFDPNRMAEQFLMQDQDRLAENMFAIIFQDLKLTV